MTGTEPRIRWEPGAEVEITAWFGHAGIIGFSLFQILKPAFPGEEHTLTANLPGQQQRRLDGDPDELKAEAERWLEEFISSLGAVFPEALLKLADEWQRFAARGDAADECADELREAVAAALQGSAEDIVAASIEQQSAWRNELRHPGMGERS